MVEFSGFTIIAFYSVCILQAGPIIDFRSMINDATRLNVEEGQDDRLLKPLGGYLGYSSEWRDLAQVISRVSQYQLFIITDVCISPRPTAVTPG